MTAYTSPLRTNSAVRADFARLVRAFSSRYTQEAADRLTQFEKLALIVWSLDDRLFPLRHGHRLSNLMPNASLSVIADSGAFIQEDRPVELAHRIGGFIDASIPTPSGLEGRGDHARRL